LQIISLRLEYELVCVVREIGLGIFSTESELFDILEMFFTIEDSDFMFLFRNYGFGLVLAHPIKAIETAMEIINNFNFLLPFKKYY